DFYNESDNTTTGVDLKQSLSFAPFKLNLNGGYERSMLERWARYYSQPYFIQGYFKDFLNIFSLSAVASMEISGGLVPSVFYKISNSTFNSTGIETEHTSSGYGADVTYKPLENLALYIGYSEFEKTFFENDKTKNLEAAVSFNSENIFSDLRYFRRKNTNIYFHPAQWSLVEKESGNMSGLGL